MSAVVTTPVRPCPKCLKSISVHASVCGYCWIEVAKFEDPRERWSREAKASRHRTLTAVLLVCAAVLSVFFVGFRAFLVRHVAAEQALVGAQKPLPPRVHPSAAPAEVDPAVSEAAPEPTPQKVHRQRPVLDPAEPMVVPEDESALSTSSANLQTVYVAICCSFFALLAALVAFAISWR